MIHRRIARLTPLLFSSLIISCSSSNTKAPDLTESPLMSEAEQKKLEAAIPGSPYQVMEKWGEEHAKTLGVPERTGWIDSWGPVYGDIDGDGDVDGIGFYNMSHGGNSLVEQIAVFLNDGKGLVFDATIEVGGTGNWMTGEVLRIESNRMTASTSIWLEDDAQCCPKGAGYVVFAYRKGSISVEKQEPKGRYDSMNEDS